MTLCLNVAVLQCRNVLLTTVVERRDMTPLNSSQCRASRTVPFQRRRALDDLDRDVDPRDNVRGVVRVVGSRLLLSSSSSRMVPRGKLTLDFILRMSASASSTGNRIWFVDRCIFRAWEGSSYMSKNCDLGFT